MDTPVTTVASHPSQRSCAPPCYLTLGRDAQTTAACSLGEGRRTQHRWHGARHERRVYRLLCQVCRRRRRR
eukprot:scaffold171563_cov31-Tisochrysis_lutea.AAC.3